MRTRPFNSAISMRHLLLSSAVESAPAIKSIEIFKLVAIAAAARAFAT
jgi:hypothetical protein